MITLNIYNDKKKVEKTYEVESYELMYGTVEDFISIIDFDKVDDQTELAKMVVNGMGKLKPLLKDVFPEITDDELRRAKVSELVQCIVQIAQSVAETINILDKSGNR